MIAGAGAGLSPECAELALVQSTMTSVAGVLAYAEGFGLVVAALGVSFDPLALVRRMVDDTIAGRLTWQASTHSFPVHLRRAILCDLTIKVGHVAATRRVRLTGAADEARMASVQLGNLAGVMKGARFLAEMMPSLREVDESTLPAAVVMTDFVRARLAKVAGVPANLDARRAALALFAPEPESVPPEVKDEPTAPLRAPAPTRPADGDDDRREEN